LVAGEGLPNSNCPASVSRAKPEKSQLLNGIATFVDDQTEKLVPGMLVKVPLNRLPEGVRVAVNVDGIAD